MSVAIGEPGALHRPQLAEEHTVGFVLFENSLVDSIPNGYRNFDGADLTI